MCQVLLSQSLHYNYRCRVYSVSKSVTGLKPFQQHWYSFLIVQVQYLKFRETVTACNHKPERGGTGSQTSLIVSGIPPLNSGEPGGPKPTEQCTSLMPSKIGWLCPSQYPEVQNGLVSPLNIYSQYGFEQFT